MSCAANCRLFLAVVFVGVVESAGGVRARARWKGLAGVTLFLGSLLCCGVGMTSRFNMAAACAAVNKVKVLEWRALPGGLAWARPRGN